MKMKKLSYIALSLSLIACMCTKPPCLQLNNGKMNDNPVGYYMSEECHECAGFAIGSTVEDLEIRYDSTFTLRHIAVRYAFKDIVEISRTEGIWYLHENKLFARPSKSLTCAVDSVYNVISIDSIRHESAEPIYFSACGKDNCLSNCREIFKKQEKKMFEDWKQTTSVEGNLE